MRTRAALRAAALALACAAAAAAAAGSPFWGCASLDRGVALTYDDGPGAFTETLLDALRAANATAAFFVLAGAAVARPATVRRALAEGHTVGLHSWTHANLSALWEAQDWSTLRHEVDDAADALAAITGQRPRFFRPPYGALTPGVRDYLHARGFVIAMWSSGCIDWALHDAVRETSIYIDGFADAGGVLCLHDIHASTVAGTAALVAALRSGREGGWVNPQGRALISLDRCRGASEQPWTASVATA
jgi:peptidoglycan/xylan/chitin deacetylase (PgdA/CDA1 family)